MAVIKILWADDEIEMLKPHLFFLEKKGYEVITVTNGYDALEEIEAHHDIDVIFLDESMPGITGIETLAKIKQKNANIPIVMITKNEAENLMEEAIGAQIDDYLIKPVNPNQILLTLKKLIDNKKLIREKTSLDYQSEFRNIFMEINNNLDHNQWVDVYKKIISWELKIDASKSDMKDILSTQKEEANAEFSKFIEKNYEDWIKDQDHGPVLSNNLLRKKVFPNLDKNIPTVLLVMDNLRYDQWKIIEPILLENFRKEEEDAFFSILPTATQYSRNAIFAGLLPSEIAKKYPKWWVNDNEEGGKNLYEEQLVQSQIDRIIRRELKMQYIKVTNIAAAKKMQDHASNLLRNDLTVIVYNFIDMLSHARTEMEVLKELAGDETAYRSLTRSWFLNSALHETLKKLAQSGIQLFVTTDHGTIRVKQPVKIIGDRESSTNLRYKVGRKLQFNEKQLLAFKDPESVGLPRPNVSSTFVFTKKSDYLLYPKNYNYYKNFYHNTFQHGGISLEEIICPIIKMRSK